jgi:hypothetical protein
MRQTDDTQDDKAGTRWDDLSREITEIEEDIFKVVKAKHMHNESHEKMFKELVDIRNVGRCMLDKLAWIFKYACSSVSLIRMIMFHTNNRTGTEEGNKIMIISKKGTINQYLAMTAMLKMWMPAAKKVKERGADEQRGAQGTNEKMKAGEDMGDNEEDGWH